LSLVGTTYFVLPHRRIFGIVHLATARRLLSFGAFDLLEPGFLVDKSDITVRLQERNDCFIITRRARQSSSCLDHSVSEELSRQSQRKGSAGKCTESPVRADASFTVVHESKCPIDACLPADERVYQMFGLVFLSLPHMAVRDWRDLENLA
jgi:hypothetical protein